MAKTAQTTQPKPDMPKAATAGMSTAADLNQTLVNAALDYQAQGLERMMGMTRGCLAFGAKRLERETGFWTELSRTKGPKDMTTLWVEFMRTTQHDYLDELNRQMETIARATSETVTELENRLDEGEDAVEQALAGAKSVAV